MCNSCAMCMHVRELKCCSLYWLCFLKVWPALGRSGLLQVIFYCFQNKSFVFLIVPVRPVLIQKHFGSEMCKASAALEGDWVTPHQPIKRIVYSLTVSRQIMVLCSYVQINLVFYILLWVKIIVQVYAFVGLLAGTFGFWRLFCWAESTCIVAIGNLICGRGYTCL